MIQELIYNHLVSQGAIAHRKGVANKEIFFLPRKLICHLYS